MTGVLVTAVVLLALLTLLTLALLLAIVRRLREHETRLAELAAGGAGMPALIAPPGTAVTGLDVPLPALVGFFSPTCSACHERLPAFRDAAAAHPGGTVAVVVADSGDPAELVAALDGTGTVRVETADGPLASAFEVRGFPAFAVVDPDGRIRSSGFELPAAVR